MEREDLRHKFRNEQGTSCQNEQGEPDIDYVRWLEDEVMQRELETNPWKTIFDSDSWDTTL